MTVSQAQRGGQWNELGVFAFAAGQDYDITLSDDANGTVVADAVYVVKVEAISDAVTWAPVLPAGGSYQVYAKWTADETRATDALYRVVHDGGTAEVSVNQRTGGRLWHYLGSYTFDPLNSPTVTLAANDNGSVAADAIRFVGGPVGATDIAYLHNDHLGTPQVMTDAAAQVLWWRDQTPFGQTVATGGFSASPLRFPGQYADTESGLAYNYFRDYDPALGRYIQSDPIGLRGGLNTYGYVQGNPTSRADPQGLKWDTEDFLDHYWNGGGAPVDLDGIGLLDDFTNSTSVQSAINRVFSGYQRMLKNALLAKCTSCNDIVTMSFDVHDFDESYDVTSEGALFSLGKGELFNKGKCIGVANCKTKTVRIVCSFRFYIRDWFRDPIGLGVEVGGTPYRINGDWNATTDWRG